MLCSELTVILSHHQKYDGLCHRNVDMKFAELFIAAGNMAYTVLHSSCFIVD